MRILRIEAGSASSGALARVDVAIGGVRLKGLLLKRNARGEYRIFAPNLGGRAVADFDLELAAEITVAAVAALGGGRSAHDSYN